MNANDIPEDPHSEDMGQITPVDEAEEQHQETPDSEYDSPFKEFVHHQRIAIEELGRAIESLLPQEFREHTKNAGKAFVESFKTFVEATREDIEEIRNRRESEDGAENAESSSGGTKIKVDVE